MATLKTIAENLDLSISTVSRILNGKAMSSLIVLITSNYLKNFFSG